MSTCVGVALVLISPLLSMAQNGRISGKVTDGADHSPILGVMVRVEFNGQLAKVPTITEKDGAYKVEGLMLGKTYQVSYSDDDEGYTPDVRSVTVTSVQNPILWKHRAATDYWMRTAATMEKDIEALPAEKRADGPAEAWKALRNSGVSAEGLAIVANHLKARPGFSDLPSRDQSFQLYSQADPKRLKALEDAFRSNSTPPVFANFDVKLYQDIDARERAFHKYSGVF